MKDRRATLMKKSGPIPVPDPAPWFEVTFRFRPIAKIDYIPEELDVYLGMKLVKLLKIPINIIGFGIKIVKVEEAPITVGKFNINEEMEDEWEPVESSDT